MRLKKKFVPQKFYTPPPRISNGPPLRNVVRSIFWIYLVSASIVTHLSQQLVGMQHFFSCHVTITSYCVCSSEHWQWQNEYLFSTPRLFPLSKIRMPGFIWAHCCLMGWLYLRGCSLADSIINPLSGSSEQSPLKIIWHIDRQCKTRKTVFRAHQDRHILPHVGGPPLLKSLWSRGFVLICIYMYINPALHDGQV
jgi:hypothetical protein